MAGGQNVFVSGNVLTAAQVNSYLMDQAVMKVTSGTRPTAMAQGGALIEGTVIHESDTDCIQVYSGAAWIQIGPLSAWTTFTPTLTAGATVTKTTTYAAYMRVGRLIAANVYLAITGAGTASNAVQVGLPVAAQALGSPVLGSFSYTDSGTGIYSGVCTVGSSTSTVWGQAGEYSTLVVNNIGAQPAFTTASGDTVSYGVHYEAAA